MQKNSTVHRTLLFSFFSLVIIPITLASHVAGGEITYECLGGNQYRINYSFFRDCNGAGMPSSVRIDIYNASGTVVQNPNLPLISTTQINASPPTPCTVIPPGLCLEVGEYEAVVTLPPSPGGYTLTYDICCRNAGIVNGPAGSAAYLATIPDPGLAACNSNATFNNPPPTFICRGDSFSIDLSATDIDGDSLSYALCSPYESVFPNTPYPFGSGFTASNPLGGPISIDPVTGIMTGVPPNIGTFVVGVCVEEYRNGVLISTTTRDFQLISVNCTEITVASALTANTNCANREVTFFNNSTGASTYLWDFGDGTTSTDVNPVHNYPAFGTYNVTLIGYNGTNPSCNDTTTAILALVDTCRPCGMVVNVTTIDGICNPLDGCAEVTWIHPCAANQSIQYGGVTITGGCASNNSIGTGAAPLVGNVIATVDGVALPSAQTTESVTILGPTSPCAGFVSTSNPSPGFIQYTFNAIYTEPQTGGAYITISGGTPPYNVQWATTPTQVGDTATALDPGTYSVIVTDANGCVQVEQFVVAGASNMNLTMSGTDITACGANDGTASVTVTGNTGALSYLWTPGGFTTPSVNGLAPGLYTVQVTDDSCSTSDTIRINDVADVQVTVSVSDITCPTETNGSATVISTTGGTAPYTYSWNSSPVQTGPTASNLPFGFYTVVATDDNGCTGQTSFSITGPVAMSTTVTGTPNSCNAADDGTATLSLTGGTSPYNLAWNTAPVQTGFNANNLPGGQFAVVTVTDDNGCIVRDSVFIDQPPAINVDLFDLSTIDCSGVFEGAATAAVTGGQPNLVDISTLVSEEFNIADQEIGCNIWYTDVSGGGTNTIMDPSDFFRVINNQFQGQDLDGEAVWRSAVVDISAETNVTISGDFFECGFMEATDYIRAYYSINGGPEVLWFDLTDDGATDCTVNSPSLAGLSGNTIQIIIRVLNNSGENHRFDNINITGNISGVLYNEAFNTNDLWNDPDCNWTRDVSAVATTDISGAGTADHVETRNGVLEFQDVDGEIIWYSTVLDISGCNSVDVSMDFGYSGNFSATEYIRGYYILDGGPEVLWIDHTDDTPAFWPNGNPSTDVLSGISGNTLQLVVRVNNTGSSDIHTLDNFVVTCSETSPNPYALAWSCTGATTDTVSGLPTGLCTMTATDSAGCTGQNFIDIVDPGTVSATVTTVDACGATANGSATALPSGGNAPYSFAWSCSGDATQAISGLTGGTNCTVTVTDANGCEVAVSSTVNSSPSFALDTTVIQSTCAVGASIDLEVIGGTPAFSYSWSTGETTQDVFGLAANTTYTVGVFDANLCFESLDIFIDSSCILLSNNILEFYGEAEGTENRLFWHTENQYNTNYFLLEKSRDGLNWTTVGMLEAAGNSNMQMNYNYVDDQPYTSTYYRLMQQQLDGTFTYSNVILLENPTIRDLATVLFFPNPADEQLTISIPAAYIQGPKLSIEVLNALGQIVKFYPLNPAEGEDILFELKTTTFPAGVYFVNVKQQAVLHSEKIIIRH
jgi:hypothetical protein